MARNIQLYLWFQACRSLLFWQAIWFLYFQNVLSAGEAILLAAIYDVASSVLEVPSGYMSDRLGRRLTLMLSMIATIAGCLLIGLGGDFWGGGFWWLALGQVLIGAGTAFNSGTDTALLYDSLLDAGREDEITEQELKAWRFSFTGLAISAFAGGVMSVHSGAVAFLATAVAGSIALAIAWQFREPQAGGSKHRGMTLLGDGRVVLDYLRQPPLAWIFALTVAMYIFSHVPFVFGQPFIEQMLGAIGLSRETTTVSGAIVAAMMLVSVAAGWIAGPIQARIGTMGILLLAFAMQIGLIGVLMASTHPFAIAFLLVRMVPGAFYRPFVLAIIHPRLESSTRATYLSLQSLFGRIGLAVSLFAVSSLAPGDSAMDIATLQSILLLYVIAGAAIFAGLALTSKALDGA